MQQPRLPHFLGHGYQETDLIGGKEIVPTERRAGLERDVEVLDGDWRRIDDVARWEEKLLCQRR